MRYCLLDALQTNRKREMDRMVRGIISALELKDDYTLRHSERVAYYGVMLARHMNRFREEELQSFHYACLLHDMGKATVPDSILMKDTELTREEYDVIKLHTEAGADVIKAIRGLEPCVPVILHHHERWDGCGYPKGLKGKAIPLLARVAAIADAFDAMTTNRIYRKALSPCEAKRRILEGSGTQFDPELVDTFVQIYPAWEAWCHDYHSEEEAAARTIKLKRIR